ncbi:DUF5615 family PIN-like protein [Candidatus Pacearchaeota archaeon]|nr:DUF5615 family PIN-like protein [Candidatus Pacearchaeota archaeon]
MLPSNIPKLLCDANIPYKLSNLLKKQGFDIIEPPSFAKDSEVAELSNSENRVILTFDRHFGNINLFPPEKYSGIVFIRIMPPLINSVFLSLTNLFNSVKSSEFKGKLFILSLAGFRVFPKSGR